MGTLRDSLNTSNPSLVADAERKVRLGDALAKVPAFVRAPVVANKLVLPSTAKAIRVIACFVTAGGVNGYFVPDAGDATPATGHVIANQTGDIEFLAADLVTEAEVEYEVCEGEVVTETILVAASVGTLNNEKAARQLLSARIVAGVLVGATPAVDVRGTAAPAAGECALSLLGKTIVFNAAEVIAGQAEVTYIATPGVGTAQAALQARLLTPAAPQFS